MRIVLSAQLVLILIVLPLMGLAGDGTSVYRGHLVIGPEAEVFKPCGANTDYWLDVDLVSRNALAERYMKLVKGAYDGVFVVFRGSLGPQLDCGFCEHYPGSFKVTETLELRSSGAGDCK